MTCEHLDISGTSRYDDEGHHVRDVCRNCGAIRTYTATKDGLMLGGYWTELEGQAVVKRKGLQENDEGKPD